MLFQALHQPTLLMVTAVHIAFSGLALILAGRRGRPSVALRFWGAAMMVGAIGIILSAVPADVGPSASLAGTVVILFGTALAWTGARVFSGRHPRPAIILVGPLALLILGASSLGTADLIQVALASAIGAAYTVATAFELWRGREELLRARKAAIGLLLLHAGVHSGRAAAAAFATPGSLMLSSEILTVILLEALLHTTGMAFLLLALMKERAEMRSMNHLRELALLDALTGLGNRRQFDQALDRELRRAIRDHTSLALLMIDADHFKAYNDSYGHQAGDNCLRAIGSAIRSVVQRPSDVRVRYGGEEFAVLLTGTDEVGALAVADAIQANIAALQMRHAGSPHGQVSASIGVASVRPDRGTIRGDKLVRAADRALYAAKAAGRNRTHRASQSDRHAPVLTLVGGQAVG